MLLNISLIKLDQVPNSKEDVFSNQTVPLLEKRRLMKFLNTAVETEDQGELLKGNFFGCLAASASTENLGEKSTKIAPSSIS